LKKLIDSDPFVVAGKTKSNSLASGKIPINRSKVENTLQKPSSSSFSSSSSSFSYESKSKVNLKDIKVWSISDPQAPPFSEDSFKIAKSCILFERRNKFAVIELHVHIQS